MCVCIYIYVCMCVYICVCVCVTDNNKVLLYNIVNYISISCDKP